MTVPPEYSEEEVLREQAGGTMVPGRPDLSEAEIDEHADEELDEHARESAEVNYLDPEGNEAHAPGEVCPRCGTVITARPGRTVAGRRPLGA